MTNLIARNALFDSGISLGLRWTRGDAANGTPTIYLPLRNPQAMRASLHPASHNWMLSWTTPVHGTESIMVDKLNRDDEAVLRALAAAVELVVERSIETEPESALQIIGFLGALGVALDHEPALIAAAAGRTRAREIAQGISGA